MSSRSDSSSSNPYADSLVPSAPALQPGAFATNPLSAQLAERSAFDTPIPFAGEVLWSDLIRVTRKPLRFIAAGIPLALLVGYMGLGGLIWILSGVAPLERSSLMVLMMIMTLLAIECFRCVGTIKAWAHLRTHPDLLGPIQGRFIDHRIEWQTKHGQRVMSLEAIPGFQVRFDGVILALNPSGTEILLLPDHLFAGASFHEVSSVLHPQSIMRPWWWIRQTPRNPTDTLYPLPPPPSDAVTFSRHVPLNIPVSSNPYWTVQALLPLSRVLLTILPLCLVADYQGPSAMWIIFTAILVTLTLSIWSLPIRLWSIGPRRHDRWPIAGWIDSNGIAFVTTLGGTFVSHAQIKPLWKQDGECVVTLPKNHAFRLPLAPQDFADPESWAKASEWLKAPR